MRKRSEKTIDTNLLFPPAFPVDCCVFGARLLWQKGQSLTISAPVPWLSSGHCDFEKKAWDPCLQNREQTYIRAYPNGHMEKGALRVMPRRRWRYGRFRYCYDGYKPRFFRQYFAIVRLWFFPIFLKNTRRRPDTNGRGNALFYLVIFWVTSKMGQIKIQV